MSGPKAFLKHATPLAADNGLFGGVLKSPLKSEFKKMLAQAKANIDDKGNGWQTASSRAQKDPTACRMLDVEESVDALAKYLEQRVVLISSTADVEGEKAVLSVQIYPYVHIGAPTPVDTLCPAVPRKYVFKICYFAAFWARSAFCRPPRTHPCRHLSLHRFGSPQEMVWRLGTSFIIHNIGTANMARCAALERRILR